MIQQHIADQQAYVQEFFGEKFNIDIKGVENSNVVLEALIINITALKTWSLNLRDVVPNNSAYYLNEIVSNLNHAVLLCILGLKIPSYTMIRRSQENLLSFIYYKDHPVEFEKKELDFIKKNQMLKIDELRDYIESYPFQIHYSDLNLQELKKFVKQLSEDWKTQYQDLSHYVHGTNSKYLELMEFLEQINLSKEFMTSMAGHIHRFSSVVNSLFIVFFFNKYKSFDQHEKQLIRWSITNDFGYKEQIRHVFKDL
jgi:hypothetical protein